MTTAQYSVGTWDTEAQAFTPQIGLSVPSFNMTIHQLRTALKELRRMGYAAKRWRLTDGSHISGDDFTIVERTDGEAEAEIRERWKR